MRSPSSGSGDVGASTHGAAQPSAGRAEDMNLDAAEPPEALPASLNPRVQQTSGVRLVLPVRAAPPPTPACPTPPPPAPRRGPLRPDWGVGGLASAFKAPPEAAASAPRSPPVMPPMAMTGLLLPPTQSQVVVKWWSSSGGQVVVKWWSAPRGAAGPGPCTRHPPAPPPPPRVLKDSGAGVMAPTAPNVLSHASLRGGTMPFSPLRPLRLSSWQRQDIAIIAYIPLYPHAPRHPLEVCM